MGLDCRTRAGAWIETPMNMVSQKASVVAPRAGAWIETLCLSCSAVFTCTFFHGLSAVRPWFRHLSHSACGCVD